MTELDIRYPNKNGYVSSNKYNSYLPCLAFLTEHKGVGIKIIRFYIMIFFASLAGALFSNLISCLFT